MLLQKSTKSVFHKSPALDLTRAMKILVWHFVSRWLWGSQTLQPFLQSKQKWLETAMLRDWGNSRTTATWYRSWVDSLITASAPLSSLKPGYNYSQKCWKKGKHTLKELWTSCLGMDWEQHEGMLWILGRKKLVTGACFCMVRKTWQIAFSFFKVGIGSKHLLRYSSPAVLLTWAQFEASQFSHKDTIVLKSCLTFVKHPCCFLANRHGGSFPLFASPTLSQSPSLT